jgi:hypothetical protein
MVSIHRGVNRDTVRCWIGREVLMSARNGDKSRYQINRKRAVLRRAKNRQLVKSVKSGPAQAAKTAAK